MRIIKSLVFTVALIFGSVANASIMLWLDPVAQTNVNTGDDISLKIMISGLENNSPQSLGNFDLAVFFDTSALSFTGYNMFDALGDVGDGWAFDDSPGESSPGIIELLLSSFVDPNILDTSQPDMFALAELYFHVDVLNAGESSLLSLFVNDLGDSSGIQYDLTDVTIGDDAVISANRVPAPASMIFLGFALVIMFIRLNKTQLTSKLASFQKGISQNEHLQVRLA